MGVLDSYFGCELSSPMLDVGDDSALELLSDVEVSEFLEVSLHGSPLEASVNCLDL